MPSVRLLRDADVAATAPLTEETFADLDRRRGETPADWGEERRGWFQQRVRSFLANDPGGQWAADAADGALAGVALSSRRDGPGGGLWGLSLLVVRPGLQAQGVGRALMEAAMGYAEGCRTGIICASDDPRALRRYAAAGFRLHPAYSAKGRPLVHGRADPAVREGADPQFAAAVDASVRGADRGPDRALMDARPTWWLRYERGGTRGYAMADPERHVGTVAATEPTAAAALLTAVLARYQEMQVDCEVHWITAGQRWAMDSALAAGLRLEIGGSVCWRGREEPNAYLPNGALL